MTFPDLQKRVKEYAEERKLEISKGFIFFVLEEVMDLSEEEAHRCVVDGPYDGGVDVIYADEQTSEILILQSKFTENIANETLKDGIKDLVRGVKYVCGEKKKRIAKLDAAIASLDLDRLVSLPEARLKVVFATSAKVGDSKHRRRELEKKYSKNLEKFLSEKGLGAKGEFEILDFRVLSELLGEVPGIDKLSLSVPGGEYFLKSGNKAVIFTANGSEIGKIVEQYGEDLFENNVRRFLGFRGNINKGIRDTLQDDTERRLFWYFNNGIVAVCDNFEIDRTNGKVTFRNFSIVNGAQTASILSEVGKNEFILSDVGVLMKVINLGEVGEGDKIDLMGRITLAANSQNPTNTRDLRAVDKIQRMLEQKLHDQGYSYLRRRGIGTKKTDKTIRMKDVAQAYTSFYLDEPYTAYARVNEIFGKNDYYEKIFPRRLSEMTKDEVTASLAKYVFCWRLLQLVRNRIKQEPPDLQAMTYHILWSFKLVCSKSGTDVVSFAGADDAENRAKQIYNQIGNQVFEGVKAAINNLKGLGGGFTLPKEAKSKEGFEKFKKAFEINYKS